MKYKLNPNFNYDEKVNENTFAQIHDYLQKNTCFFLSFWNNNLKIKNETCIKIYKELMKEYKNIFDQYEISFEIHDGIETNEIEGKIYSYEAPGLFNLVSTDAKITEKMNLEFTIRYTTKVKPYFDSFYNENDSNVLSPMQTFMIQSEKWKNKVFENFQESLQELNKQTKFSTI